jgi:myosin heavy subunit
VLAALRVARAGYPDRKPLRAFVERFAVCLPGDGRSSTLARCRAAANAAGLGDFDASLDGLAVTDDVDAPTAQDLREGEDEDLVLDRAVVAAALPWRKACEDILRCLERGGRKGALAKHPALKPGRVFVGKTKVFLRDGALDDIERVRAVVCFDLAARLQAHGRGYLGKKYYRKVLRALLIVACALRVKLARRRAAKRRRLVKAISCFQARWRGIDIRMVGYLQLAKAAALTIQTKIARPEVARRRCILVRDLRARGENLDSITKRLNRIAMEKAGSIPKPSSQRGSAVARAASMGRHSGSGGSISGAEKAELEGEANAMRELAGEASKALEEIRAENAELREKARLLALDVEAEKEKGRRWQQREQVLAAVVDEARREATKATAAMHRHMADSAALAGASEANDAYARFRRKLLRHSDSMTPAMRSKLLEQKRPTQKVTITRADLARFVSDCQTLGLEVVKHNRKGKADRRLLKLTSDAAALYWTMPNGKAATGKERFYLHKCLELRAGHDVDPDARNKLICGTETLRKSLQAKHCKLAFSFIFADRTVDVSFATVEDCKRSMRYFKAHVQDLKNKADHAVMLKDEQHIASTPVGKNGAF